MCLVEAEFYGLFRVENILTFKSIKDVSIIDTSIYKKNDYAFLAKDVFYTCKYNKKSSVLLAVGGRMFTPAFNFEAFKKPKTMRSGSIHCK